MEEDIRDSYRIETPDEIKDGEINEEYSIDYIEFKSPFINKTIKIIIDEYAEFDKIKGENKVYLSQLLSGETYKIKGVLVSTYGKLRGGTIGINFQNTSTNLELKECLYDELYLVYEWAENPNFSWDFYGTATKIEK